jgi:hypothetical protein
MPFTKITSGKDAGKYRSPSGRVWTKAQMQAYEAKQHGTSNKPAKKG